MAQQPNSNQRYGTWGNRQLTFDQNAESIWRAPYVQLLEVNNPPLTYGPTKVTSGTPHYYEARFGGKLYYSYNGEHWKLNQRQNGIENSPPDIQYRLVDHVPNPAESGSSNTNQNSTYNNQNPDSSYNYHNDPDRKSTYNNQNPDSSSNYQNSAYTK